MEILVLISFVYNDPRGAYFDKTPADIPADMPPSIDFTKHGCVGANKNKAFMYFTPYGPVESNAI